MWGLSTLYGHQLNLARAHCKCTIDYNVYFSGLATKPAKYGCSSVYT